MKKLSKIIVINLAILYLAYLFILPPILNSAKIDTFFENLIYTKTGIQINAENIKFKAHPNFILQLLADEIDIYKNDKKIFDGDEINIEIALLTRSLKSVNFNHVYIDKNGVKNLFPEHNKSKKTRKINYSSLPEIYIKLAEIYFKDENDKNTKIIITNIDTDNKKDSFNDLSFEAEIISDYLNDKIKIVNNDNILYNSKCIFLDNLNISFGESNLYLKGKIETKKREYNIDIDGKDIPIHDLESSLLYFLKLKKPKKNFMENFTDYTGRADVDLEISNNGVNGTVFTKGLGGKTVLFGVPIKFNDFTTFFNGDEIKAEAFGKLGYEDVYTNFYLQHYKKEKRTITGSVQSKITNRTTSKYLPDVIIDKDVEASVNYKIENATPKIDYTIKANKGSNIHYKSASLGLTEADRRIFVSTTKYPDKLEIDNYDYSHINNGEIIKIITGDGLFEENNKKLHPTYITGKTEQRAPVSLTGDFGKRLVGGTFEGNLKYDFIKHLLTGNFNLSNSKYKNFSIRTADIIASENTMEISSDGTFLGSQYKCYLNMDNNFIDYIKIHNLDLFLDKYIIVSNKRNKEIKNINKSQLIKKAKNLDYTIENGTIKINKLIHKKILIENIDIAYVLEENMLNFKTKEAYFAKGKLQANGTYNIKTYNALIDFSADEIDSDSAATMVFNLPNEIKGTARAKLHALINTKTRDLKASADFSIKKGYLTKIGNTEFIVKKSKRNDNPLKFKLSDIINIDITEAKVLASDIDGSFDICNLNINNANLFSKQKYLSMFIEGDYNIEKEYADIKIWGKYNKTARNSVKVFFVPLSIIMKIMFRQEKTLSLYKNEINKIPDINAQDDEIEFFSVKINGNINKNDIKVDLKSIK